MIHPAERATWRINGRERTLRKKHGISLRTVTDARDREQRRQQLAESLEQMAADADERDGGEHENEQAGGDETEDGLATRGADDGERDTDAGIDEGEDGETGDSRRRRDHDSGVTTF